MPFKSAKQRRYLHANHPKIAKRWEAEYGAKPKKKKKKKSGTKSKKKKRWYEISFCFQLDNPQEFWKTLGIDAIELASALPENKRSKDKKTDVISHDKKAFQKTVYEKNKITP